MRTAFFSGNLPRLATVIAVGGLLAIGVTASASAQSQRTPKSWNYELKDGKPVRKGDRVTNADGSWREVIRQGKCTTVKEKTAAGEYRETRECSPQ